MPETPTYDKIRNLLADGETESAVNSLLQLARDSEKDYFTSALLLKNRLETLQHNEIEGVLNQSDGRTEWARISKGVMNLVEQMERRELPKRPKDLLVSGTAEPEKTDQVDKPGGNLIKWWLPATLAGLVLLFFVPKLVGDKNANPATINEMPDKPRFNELPGQLIFYDESPVADAVITVKGFDQEYTARTDSKGSFILKVNPDLIGKVVDFNVRIKDKDHLETIRLIPENIRRFTLEK